MSHVFISYKREDEPRVAPLIRALEESGLQVWSDHALAVGTDWRQQIERALDEAGCVVVVWTRDSVSPAGDFVRDEAGRAKSRGVLIPVRLDPVDPPLGFGEIQAINLTGWKGGTRDPFFADLVAAARATIEGRPVPPPKGPRHRLARRLGYGTLMSAAATSAVVFGLNAFAIQDRACAMSIFQPAISDTCGALGIGNRPTKSERIAWQARVPGSCEALRTHVQRFPTGAYRQRAADLLTSRRVSEQEVWTPGERRLSMFVAQEGSFPGKPAAQAASLARSQLRAERQCKSFAATLSFRLVRSRAESQAWNCEPLGRGITCGFEGEAVCTVEERQVHEVETCPE